MKKIVCEYSGWGTVGADRVYADVTKSQTVREFKISQNKHHRTRKRNGDLKLWARIKSKHESKYKRGINKMYSFTDTATTTDSTDVYFPLNLPRYRARETKTTVKRRALAPSLPLSPVAGIGIRKLKGCVSMATLQEGRQEKPGGVATCGAQNSFLRLCMAHPLKQSPISPQLDRSLHYYITLKGTYYTSSQ